MKKTGLSLKTFLSIVEIYFLHFIAMEMDANKVDMCS